MYYYVRFIRNDQQPNEEYLYQRRCDATYHFKLFRDDDSGLYKEISLGYVKQSKNQEITLQKYFFSNANIIPPAQ